MRLQEPWGRRRLSWVRWDIEVWTLDDYLRGREPLASPLQHGFASLVAQRPAGGTGSRTFES